MSRGDCAIQQLTSRLWTHTRWSPQGGTNSSREVQTLLLCMKSREEKVRGPGPGSPGPNSSLGAEHLLRCSLPGAGPLRREEREAEIPPTVLPF